MPIYAHKMHRALLQTDHGCVFFFANMVFTVNGRIEINENRNCSKR